MEIGVGHLNVIPEASGASLIDWARRADELGFSTLATIDRVVFPTYDSLVSLAAAAAVTSRIGLMTDILLGATRNPHLLAKAAASVDQLSGGRLVLGLSAGAREEDFAATGTGFHDRGRRLDAAVELMRTAWGGEAPPPLPRPVSPRPVGGQLRLMFGGGTPASVRRAATWGIGLAISGATPPDRAAELVAEVKEAWAAAGRDGEPRFTQLKYFAMGPDARERAGDYLASYYGEAARANADRAAKNRDELRRMTGTYEAMGVHEVVFFPTIADPDQIDMLAEAAFG
ncbi:MAG: LLM class flavin-dependent oxidoreductase [Candidatus Dormibacterales bacterium]